DRHLTLHNIMYLYEVEPLKGLLQSISSHSNLKK
uniref:Uncharacterized protein n=1 Tax=Oryzias latipes TaxID=8090 RepID=A0A3P9IAF3_ORYLA